MGERKLLLPYGGRTVIEAGLESALASSVGGLRVVLGGQADLVEEKIARLDPAVGLRGLIRGHPENFFDSHPEREGRTEKSGRKKTGRNFFRRRLKIVRRSDMKKTAILFLAVLVTGVLAMAHQVNLTGDWTYTMTMGQRGPMEQTMKIVQEGEKLKVTMISQRGDVTREFTGEGTVKDKAVEWKIVRQGRDGQEMTTIYKGEIVDENNMKGTMEGGFGGGGGGQAPEWKAVRKPK